MTIPQEQLDDPMRATIEAAEKVRGKPITKSEQASPCDLGIRAVSGALLPVGPALSALPASPEPTKE
jgi:hypothetical protein